MIGRQTCRVVVRALDRDIASIAFDLDARDIAIGRGADAAIRLPHPDIAVDHARIVRAGDGRAVACAQADGCVVAGTPLAVGDERRLTSGDELILAGRFALRFYARCPTGASPTSGDHTTSIARALARDVIAQASARPDVHVVADRGPAAGRTFPVPPGARLIIGRGPDSDICVADPDLSRDHAVIAHTPGGVRVGDLGSKNGTYVSGERLSAGELREFRAGDRVELGGSSLRLCDPVAAYLRKLDRGEPVAHPRSASGDELPAPTPAGVSWLVTAVCASIMFGAALALVWLVSA